jgi:hypothetical protein
MKLDLRAHGLTVEQEYLHPCRRACSSIPKSRNLGHIPRDCNGDIHGDDGRMAWKRVFAASGSLDSSVCLLDTVEHTETSRSQLAVASCRNSGQRHLSADQFRLKMVIGQQPMTPRSAYAGTSSSFGSMSPNAPGISIRFFVLMSQMRREFPPSLFSQPIRSLSEVKRSNLPTGCCLTSICVSYHDTSFA